MKVPLKRAQLAASIKKGRADRQGFVDLAAFLQWLWPMTAVPERYCRSMCMWLMEKLALLQMEHTIEPGVLFSRMLQMLSSGKSPRAKYCCLWWEC